MHKEKKKTQKSTLKQVLEYIKKYNFLLVLSILFAVVSVVLTLYIPILVGDAIDQIVGPSQVNFSKIRTILIWIILLAMFTALSQWIMNAINNKITFQVVQDIRQEAFEKLQILPLKF